jgi:hypothetical protein
VRLVGDHGESFALGRRELPYRLEGEGEGLDRADHDLLVAREGLGQFAALAAGLAVDRGHHPRLPLEAEERLLELGVDHVPVGDDEDAVEELPVRGVVQLGEKVGRPRDRVRLARSGAVLDEVFRAGPVGEDRGLEFPGHVELVVTGEDDPG